MDSLADRFRGLDHLPVRVKLRRTQYEQMSSGLLLKADIDGVLARCEVKQCSDQTRACFKISLAPGANSLEHIAFDALDNARTRKAARHRPVREMNPESWQVAGCCNAFDIASPVANPD